MSTIRYGKIARLPAEVREQLNQRLANHESSTPLLAWLNALPEVRAGLAREFGGKAINKINALNWRHGGHAERWRDREARDIMKDLQSTSVLPPDAGLATSLKGRSVTDTMAEWLAARYVVGMKKQTDRSGDPAAGWERMREFCQDVVALRRGEYRAQRLEFERVRAGLAFRCEKLGLEEVKSRTDATINPGTPHPDPLPSEGRGNSFLGGVAATVNKDGPCGRAPLATGKSPEPAEYWRTATNVCPTPAKGI